MKAESKYKGSIKLSAIGDALGWITEFERDPSSLREKFNTEKIDQFYSWEKKVGGRFYGYVDYIKAGSYSDDTQLLLAVARSIKSDGSLNNDYFAKIELANWLDYSRGGGRTVKTAAEKIQRKSVQWFNNFYSFKVNGENNDYRQSGANGAAMRVLPIAMANLGDTEKIKEEIFCNSIITHGHPRALLGAMLYGYAINQIIVIRPEDFNWENYITQIGLDFPNKFNLSFINKPEIKVWLKEWNRSSGKPFELLYEEILIETRQYLRLIYNNIKQNISVKETLQQLGCFASATKGSGTSTVIAGIYLATRFHNKPLFAIVEAVNALGSDTDSIAAFVGGLTGALHGHNIIPEKWKRVQDIEYLDKISERLLAISEGRFEEKRNNFQLEKKVLNNPLNDDFELNQEIEFVPLGKGEIVNINRQPTLTKGKYNLLIEANLEIGQSILVSKIFNNSNVETVINTNNPVSDIEAITELASINLKPNVYEQFKEYIAKHTKLSKEQIRIFELIIKNER
ncbi:ADP-ribosylglycohydrolase family protein [Sphingobacterium sp. UBA5996]|uniref:ADP-ribosylglycohydrolase family protein n=1 Tax=Sphingobacterium sp. UBA5996 TaxID=1947505 RepID=UPI0025F8517B|nr:ADP-ribosylglycohydrolase family protein [Sphingobacterium sp. UBA5996]